MLVTRGRSHASQITSKETVCSPLKKLDGKGKKLEWQMQNFLRETQMQLTPCDPNLSDFILYWVIFFL